MRAVARAVDAVLCLFPFEPAYYTGVPVQAHYVGHPLARELASAATRETVRRHLGIAAEARVIALLPGSRENEVRLLGPILLEAGRMLRSRDPRRTLLLPTADAGRHAQCEALLRAAGPAGQGVRLLAGHAREAMIAADVVLLASGTASLEALLLERPMVIAYRLSPLSWAILSRLARTRHVGLPNILAGQRTIVPELLQERLSAASLALAAEELLHDARPQLTALADARRGLQLDFDSALRRALATLLPVDAGAVRTPAP